MRPELTLALSPSEAAFAGEPCERQHEAQGFLLPWWGMVFASFSCLLVLKCICPRSAPHNLCHGVVKGCTKPGEC